MFVFLKLTFTHFAHELKDLYGPCERMYACIDWTFFVLSSERVMG